MILYSHVCLFETMTFWMASNLKYILPHEGIGRKHKKKTNVLHLADYLLIKTADRSAIG